ncbi:HK97 gp10 family phage protein [Lachnospiraceae bacterium MD329]|nr:HK97 gp10 family phage protein [Lachnospiraceae bacterium MD329]
MNIHFDTSDVINKLGDVAENLSAGLYNALQESGEVVRKEAVLNCPVQTGRLRGSITVNVEGNTAEIGTNLEYAPFVEYGTGSKGDKSVAHTTREKWTYYSGGQFFTTSGQAPQPFLTPALKNNKDTIIKLIREAVKR